jgi:hypothetical protein
MSELSPGQADAARMLGPLEGARIPGGCDQCDAYQMVEPVAPGVWTINVYHDDWCSFLRAREAQTAPAMAIPKSRRQR